MRPSAAQVNDPYSSQTDVQLSDPVPSQLLSIASQSALGAELLSQAFDSAPTEPPSADPQKEPISVEITDASTTVENVSFNFDACRSIFSNSRFIHFFHPPSDFLLCQIFPEETPMQGHEPDSPLSDIEGDLVVVDTQTIDSPVRHTTDGKKIIHPFYPSAMIMN